MSWQIVLSILKTNQYFTKYLNWWTQKLNKHDVFGPFIRRGSRSFDHDHRVNQWPLEKQFYIMCWHRTDKGDIIHSAVVRGSDHICSTEIRESEWRGGWNIFTERHRRVYKMQSIYTLVVEEVNTLDDKVLPGYMDLSATHESQSSVLL